MPATPIPPDPEDDLRPAGLQTTIRPGAVNGRLTRLAADESAPAGQDDAVAQPADRRTIRRRVFDLAWPVIGENFLETLLGIVDTFLVGQIGAAAIAGVGSAIQVLVFVISALAALSIGSAVLVAQAVGARKLAQAGELARQSLVWSIILAIPLAVLGVWFSGPIISLFGLEPDVSQIGTEYLQVTMGTAVSLTALLLLSGVFRGAGDSRTPMMVRAIANMVNVGLSYGLIFGAFGMPELGVVGSAWATFIARTLALFLLIAMLWRGCNGVTISGRGRWWPSLKLARQILKIGIPAAVEQLLISAAFFMLTILVAGLGTLTLAAHRIAMIAMSVSFLPGIGFAMAATALVGQSVGAERPEEGAQAAAIANRWAVIWMGTIGIIFFFFASPIMQRFSDDPAVIAIGAGGLRVVALAQPFWAVFFVQAGALRGTGNTQFPLRVNASGIWIAVGLAYLLIQTIGGQLNLVWAAFLTTAPFMAFILSWRFKKAIYDEPPAEAA